MKKQKNNLYDEKSICQCCFEEPATIGYLCKECYNMAKNENGEELEKLIEELEQ